jgi:nucleoid DNA-binding protein
MSQYQNDYTKVNAKKNFCNEIIIEEVADERKVSVELVREVVHSHSRYILEIIKSGAFESISLPYLGKLKAKLRSVQKARSKISTV